MSNVLTENDKVHCGHSGTVATSGTPKLTVGGAKVLLLDGIMNGSIPDCKNQASPAKPCTKVATATGVATKLKVGGKGVVLDILVGNTDGTPQPSPLLPTQAGQSKLKAV